MSKFKNFMKANKEYKSNVHYPVTESLKDENGEPLLWVIRPITTDETMGLTKECTKVVKSKNNKDFVEELDNVAYALKLACVSIVEPNLNDKELQDSYGVMTPEELLKAMIDSPNEYQKLFSFIEEFNGFKKSYDEKVEEIKN